MKIGFIGLGTLGKTMARRLIDQGEDLTVWNRTKSKAEDLNVPIAESPADLVTKTDIVFINVSDSDAVCAILEGADGIIEGKAYNKIIIDTTTNHFNWVDHFYRTLKEKDAFYLESPVLGSVVPASKGLLTILVSGDKSAFNKARPYLDKLGEPIIYLEKPGFPAKMKVINNMVLGAFMTVLAEAVAMGEASGLNKEKVIEILDNGAGKSLVLDAKKQKLLDEDFTNHFSSAMIHKDLHYLQDLARNLKRPVMTASMAKEIFAMTFQRGWQDDDFSGVYRLFKQK